MSIYFNKTYRVSVSVDTTQYNYFALNTEEGQNFAFQSFSAGTQYVDDNSSKIELFFDADGTGNNLELVDAIYTTSETYQHRLDPNVLYACTAASRVLVKRSVQSGGAPREIYANWQGFIL